MRRSSLCRRVAIGGCLTALLASATIGAHADIHLDYMTRENLLTSGRPFVEAFTDIVVEQILTASECRYAGPPQCPPPSATTSSSSSSGGAQ